MRIVRLNDNTRRDILKNLLKRSPDQYGEYEDTVKKILADVRENGDRALIEYTKKFDCELMEVDKLRVTEEEIDEALEIFDPKLLDVMKRAAENIRSYHEKQLQNSWIAPQPDGTILGQKLTPIEKVGVYVPGGKAAYPSSTLMCIVPAQVAGVDRIVMVTPADSVGKAAKSTLAAASITGVKEIYKVGGAQAIGALAYGTETVPKVDKIVGPGNKKRGVWPCLHRFHRRSQRDPRNCG